MTDKDKVLERWPLAYIHTDRSKKEVRRPREGRDAPALVRYIFLSGVHWTNDDAWKDAAKRLIEF